MNIYTEPFKAEHMKAIADNIIEQTFTPEEWRAIADYNEATSNALTAFLDGEIMACGGVRITKNYIKEKRWKRDNRPDKVIEKSVVAKDNTMWVVLDKKVLKHKRAMFFSAKVFIKILTPDIKVLKCQVAAGYKQGRRFVEHLGFKAMGTQNILGFDDYERVAA